MEFPCSSVFLPARPSQLVYVDLPGTVLNWGLSAPCEPSRGQGMCLALLTTGSPAPPNTMHGGGTEWTFPDWWRVRQAYVVRLLQCWALSKPLFFPTPSLGACDLFQGWLQCSSYSDFSYWQIWGIYDLWALGLVPLAVVLEAGERMCFNMKTYELLWSSL